MTKTICLDKHFGTTRLLIEEKPILESNPEDKFESILFLPDNENRKSEGGLRTKGYFKKSYKNKPLISIVTVVYNGEKYLEETIQSVINQIYYNVEYIIIDGGSSDGTIDIIKKYEDKIDYWVSEKDAGIYNAMNKGICLAQGKIIGLINADDYYEKNIFEDVITSFLLPKNDVVFGDCTTINQDGNMEKQKARPQCEKYPFLPCSMFWIWLGMSFNHPASFISQEAYKRFGLYDNSYKIAADYDLLLRIYRNGGKFRQIKKNISYFREGGVSTSPEYSHILNLEQKRIWKSSHYFIGSFVIFVRKILLLKNAILKRKA